MLYVYMYIVALYRRGDFNATVVCMYVCVLLFIVDFCLEIVIHCYLYYVYESY